MKKILTSNELKIIAIITMVIDHIGYYMYPALTAETYYILRNIGRISMPIFTFLIIQGFFHTKNLKKYIVRILGLSIITQVCLLVVRFFNINYFTNYNTSSGTYLNILFSYAFSLILLGIIDKNKSFIVKVITCILILLTYLFLEIDYGMRIPFIMISLYLIEKFLPQHTEAKENIIYLSLILLVFILSLTFVPNGYICKYSMLLSLLFIGLYNGKKGSKNKLVQYSFYIFFPLHHVALYLLSMFLFN